MNTKGSLYYYDKNVRDTQWLLLNIEDNSLIEYYQYWIKKHYWINTLQKPKHGAHISVIRGETIEDELFYKHWKKYHNDIIHIEYDNNIQDNNEHFWVKAYSKDLENIRTELGLNPIPEYNFHITIGRLLKL